QFLRARRDGRGDLIDGFVDNRGRRRLVAHGNVLGVSPGEKARRTVSVTTAVAGGNRFLGEWGDSNRPQEGSKESYILTRSVRGGGPRKRIGFVGGDRYGDEVGCVKGVWTLPPRGATGNPVNRKSLRRQSLWGILPRRLALSRW